MKYKITKQQDSEEDAIVYTLCEFGEEEGGEVILVFEADSFDQASFIRNQFLHFEPYKPFDTCWIAKVSHIVSVDDKIVEDIPYEVRTLLVVARTEAEARKKIEAEAIAYGEPYKNGDQKDVRWAFDKILSLKEVDFFSTIDLYKGIPVEIDSKRGDKKPEIEED